MSKSTLLSKAAAQIGIKESPAFSNLQKFGKAYGWNGVPWCVIFVWWCFRESGQSKLFYGGGKTASTEVLYQWAHQNGKWHTTGKRGDIVLMNFGTSSRHVTHAGIVEKMLDTGAQTIEGNTSSSDNANGGCVMRRSRAHSYIVGYVRPDWPAEPTHVDKTAYVDTKSSPLMLRRKPSLISRVLKKMPRGSKVIVLDRGAKWTKVRYAGVVGYCATKYLNFGG